ncbi:TDP-N-acetylfucosamine:lipid II N-acetylfucosaminyltransferase [Algoriphagus litoralis]|uniref:TDP-N-acetylfucosamine:lipid II N-acetylfucosaminyltransferase n=1 Tax=Algoriphagus litoralis TaxID=2202829 RepID=UPI000DB9AC3E|nr:TDP-N-acetylfucosamine:lipid II N-acetylfucosaminyltransferase [Algoriphagus litoralis]
MKKVLHVSRDNKFLDFAINCFEQVNHGQNYYMVIDKDRNKESVSYVKYESIHPESLSNAVELIGTQSFISQFKAVIFHGISPVEKQVLDAIQTDIKVIWFGYGFDYYPLIDFFMLRYLDKKTKKYWYQEKNGLAKIGLRINELIPFWTFFKSRNELKSVDRVDYFAPVLKQEYYEIKAKHPGFRAEYIDWNYELGKEIFDSIGQEFATGKNFLVGNSASITNNHLDCFSLLTPQIIGSNKVLVPLSYGFPKRFKNIIKSEAKSRFKEKFEPLEEFIPFHDYLSRLKSCGYALFGSIRQQALGNIYMCLALGIKVYLHPDNPILDELRNQGFHLFDFNQLKNESPAERPLPETQKKENRELMRQMSLKENYLQKTKNLISLIDSFE